MARILILQEKEEISSYWTDAFLELGYDVTVETGATSAWSAVQEQRFDLVIVDIFVRRKDQNFPEGGTLLLGRLRAKKLDAALDWMHHVPVIAVASAQVGKNNFSPLNFAKEIGASLALEKPVEIGDLIAASQRLLELSCETRVPS